DVEIFKLQIGETAILKDHAANIAWGLIVLQLLTAAFLLLKFTRRIGFYLSFILMMLFTLYIFLILNFSINIPCACVGVITEMGWKVHIYFNLALTLMAFLGIILEKNYYLHINKKLRSQE